MALNAAQQWWVRAGGNQLNGGGYDATIASPGTNYSDQDGSQVTFNGTTITATTAGVSATITITGYTVATTDVANIVRIASGTNFTPGYYCIISVNTGSSTWTLDRNCTSGVGAAMVGRMGGAHPSMINYSNGGTATAPTLTTPLVAGNTINVRGAGSDAPSSADYTQSGYYTFPSAVANSSTTSVVGYNGRPFFSTNGLWFYNTINWRFSNLKFKATSNSNFNLGFIHSTNSIINCHFDQNGNDGSACYLSTEVIDCYIFNSGSASAGTYPGIYMGGTYGGPAFGNYIVGWRGGGIFLSQLNFVINNLIVNCKLIGIEVQDASTYNFGIFSNTVDNCGSDGIKVTKTGNVTIMDNTVSNCTGYGLNIPSYSATLSGWHTIDYNNYYNNNGGGAQYNGASAATHDTNTNPTFVNSGGGNYALGVTLNGHPGVFRGSSTTGYIQMGAWQPQAVTSPVGTARIIQNIGTY